jgi:hypothetical protein
MPILAMAAGIMAMLAFQRHNRRAAMVWATVAATGLSMSVWFFVFVLSMGD